MSLLHVQTDRAAEQSHAESGKGSNVVDEADHKSDRAEHGSDVGAPI